MLHQHASTMPGYSHTQIASRLNHDQHDQWTQLKWLSHSASKHWALAMLAYRSVKMKPMRPLPRRPRVIWWAPKIFCNWRALSKVWIEKTAFEAVFISDRTHTHICIIYILYLLMSHVFSKTLESHPWKYSDLLVLHRWQLNLAS